MTTATATPVHEQDTDFNIIDATPAKTSDEQRRQRLLEAEAQRIVTLQDEIKQRQDEVESLKESILGTHEVGSYQAGALKVRVKAGSTRLDAKRFQSRFPVAENPTLYELKPKSASKIATLIGRPAFADCLSQNKPSVVVS